MLAKERFQPNNKHSKAEINQKLEQALLLPGEKQIP